MFSSRQRLVARFAPRTKVLDLKTQLPSFLKGSNALRSMLLLTAAAGMTAYASLAKRNERGCNKFWRRTQLLKRTTIQKLLGQVLFSHRCSR